MNAKTVGALVGAFAAGVSVGFAASATYIRRKMELEIQAQLESMERVYETAYALRAEGHTVNPNEWGELRVTPKVETPSFQEAAAVVIEKATEPGVADVTSFEGGLIETHDDVDDDPNTYQESVQQLGDSIMIEFIPEEEFDVEDGRFKGNIQIVLQEPPVFVLDGEPIEDWEHRIGSSIMMDFYRLVGPNDPPFLWVRNHTLDEDYEVAQVLP